MALKLPKEPARGDRLGARPGTETVLSRREAVRARTPIGHGGLAADEGNRVLFESALEYIAAVTGRASQSGGQGHRRPATRP